VAGNQRFGVDGANLETADILPELGDGWSGVNALLWEYVEPNPPSGGRHSYDWSKLDSFVQAFQKHDRNIQVNVKVINNWALESGTASGGQTTQPRTQGRGGYDRSGQGQYPGGGNRLGRIARRLGLGGGGGGARSPSGQRPGGAGGYGTSPDGAQAGGASEASRTKKPGPVDRIKPEHLQDWGAFIGALVERYDADGQSDMPGIRKPLTHLQIESEAENVFTNPEGLIECLKTAYQAAKRANSNVQIMASGFNIAEYASLPPDRQRQLLGSRKAGNKLAVLEGFFAGAEPYYDILSVHLNRDYTDIPGTAKWFQDQMRSHGYTKPIWSEDTSSGPYLTGMLTSAQDKEMMQRIERGDRTAIDWFNDEQTRLLVKKSVVAFASGIDKVFISTASDWPNYHMAIWRVMGLVDGNGKKKKSFESFRNLIRKVDGFTSVEKVEAGRDVWAYRFSRPSGSVYVLWSEKGGTAALRDLSGQVTITDRFGKTSTGSADRIPVSRDPVYVE